jgi:ankyrin repeat protein
MVEYLIQQGVSITVADKKGITPVQWAKRYNKNQIKDLLIQHGALPLNDSKKKIKEVEVKPEKPKVNERKISKRFLLTTMREGGHYEPLTDQEFEKFKVEHPDVAQYFLETTDGSADIAPISEL